MLTAGAILAIAAGHAAFGRSDVGTTTSNCLAQTQTLYQAPASVFLLAVGEIDATHPGPELLAIDASGVIYQLNSGDPAWSVQTLPITVEPTSIMNNRPTINVGDVIQGTSAPGNEVVIETEDTVRVLTHPAANRWASQIVHDGNSVIDTTWGVRIGDIDPNRPGQELFYIREGAFDVSSGYFGYSSGGGGGGRRAWQSQCVYQGEVGMDSAIGDSNPSSPGNEIVIATEMGPVYEITPQPSNPGEWPRRTLWNDFDNAGWTLRIADVLPDLPGNEIVYGSRYNDRILLSHESGPAHTMQVLFTGQAKVPVSMWDIAVGQCIPASSSLEIIGVDDLGLAYLVQFDGAQWSGAPLWHDTGGPLYAAVIADFLPQRPGDEIVVAGASGAITLILPPLNIPGDVTCDGVVNSSDLLAVINAWGPCPAPCPPGCAADLNGDCAANVADLLIVINSWG